MADRNGFGASNCLEYDLEYEIEKLSPNETTASILGQLSDSLVANERDQKSEELGEKLKKARDHVQEKRSKIDQEMLLDYEVRDDFPSYFRSSSRVVSPSLSYVSSDERLLISANRETMSFSQSFRV